CSSPESAEYTRVAANLYFLSARAASISAETPDASSSAPGASPVASITSERRESRCPVITITRSGSVCPRWIATTSITSTPFFGVRSPVNTFDGVTTSRQPPQSLEISSNLDFTQRRAAPIPRAFDFVSDSVLRVPKPTSAASMSCNDFAETACVMARNSGCVLDGGGLEAGASASAASDRASAATAAVAWIRSARMLAILAEESHKPNPSPRDVQAKSCRTFVIRAPQHAERAARFYTGRLPQERACSRQRRLHAGSYGFAFARRAPCVATSCPSSLPSPASPLPRKPPHRRNSRPRSPRKASAITTRRFPA